MALPDDYRAAVVLCDVVGCGYQEIADTLDVPVGTVRSRIHRGRAQLREVLVMTPIEPTDDRFELLDAYLDDELTVAERRSVDELLASVRRGSSRARRHPPGAVTRARACPRSTRPSASTSGLLRPERSSSVRSGSGAGHPAWRSWPVGAVAVAVVLVIAFGAGGRAVHATGRRSWRSTHVTLAVEHRMRFRTISRPMDLEEADRMANVRRPPTMANGYEWVAVYDAPGGVHLVYENGDQAMVSVFEQRGRVDWDGLPDGGTRKQMDDVDAWHAEMQLRCATDEAMVVDVVVLARDGWCVTVVGARRRRRRCRSGRDVRARPRGAVDGRSRRYAARWIAEGFGFPG